MRIGGWRERILSGEFDRYALPTIVDHDAELALTAALVAVGALTFGSFLLLRRLIHTALARMKRDNERLEGLLEWSNALGDSEHVSDVLESATERAREMESADAGYVFLKGDRDMEPALAQSAGTEAERLYTAHAGAVEEV